MQKRNIDRDDCSTDLATRKRTRFHFTWNKWILISSQVTRRMRMTCNMSIWAYWLRSCDSLCITFGMQSLRRCSHPNELTKMHSNSVFVVNKWMALEQHSCIDLHCDCDLSKEEKNGDTLKSFNWRLIWTCSLAAFILLLLRFWYISFVRLFDVCIRRFDVA